MTFLKIFFFKSPTHQYFFFRDLKVLQRSSCDDHEIISGSATLNLSYTRHDSVDDMYSVLSDNIQSKILSSAEQSPFFSIQIDEGTDFSNLTTLMIYIRYLNEYGHIDSKLECK